MDEFPKREESEEEEEKEEDDEGEDEEVGVVWFPISSKTRETKDPEAKSDTNRHQSN